MLLLMLWWITVVGTAIDEVNQLQDDVDRILARQKGTIISGFGWM
jgi:hypothetical protein